jgi:hypothetical protein
MQKNRHAVHVTFLSLWHDHLNEASLRQSATSLRFTGYRCGPPISFLTLVVWDTHQRLMLWWTHGLSRAIGHWEPQVVEQRIYDSKLSQLQKPSYKLQDYLISTGSGRVPCAFKTSFWEEFGSSHSLAQISHAKGHIDPMKKPFLELSSCHSTRGNGNECHDQTLLD